MRRPGRGCASWVFTVRASAVLLPGHLRREPRLRREGSDPPLPCVGIGIWQVQDWFVWPFYVEP